MLDHASSLTDLRVPPNNRLEALRSDRAGQHSIRINDRFRMCFVWRDGDTYVEVTDYDLGDEAMISRDAVTDHGEIAYPAARPVGPLHPGAILKEEFLQPIAISADTALRSGRCFGMSAEFWLGLQTTCDLELARSEVGERLDHEVVPKNRMSALRVARITPRAEDRRALRPHLDGVGHLR